MVDSIAEGSHPIVSEHALMRRHVAYARKAGRLLDLIEERDGGDLALTVAGRALAATVRGSAEEAQILRARIEASAGLAPLVPELLGEEEPKVEALVARLVGEAGLSGATARRRAAILLDWRRAVLGDPVDHGFLVGLDGAWRRILVTNYKSIEELRIDLPPFSALVGPNGSGKSNVADIVVFATEVCTSASAAVEKRGGIGGVRRWSRGELADVTIDVRVAGSASSLETDYVRHAFSLQSGPQPSWSFGDERVEIVQNGEVVRSIVRLGDEIEIHPERQRLPPVEPNASVMTIASQLRDFATATISLRKVLRYRLNPDAMRELAIESEVTRLDETGRNIATAVRSLHREGRGGELETRLAKIVPGLVGLGTEQVGRYIVLKFRQAQAGGHVAEFNATEMSDGALRALGILVATAQMRPYELLVVEEPEVSVHVGAAKFLHDVLREAADKGAVLITTHSADLLDAASDEEIFVCEYVDGVTRVGPLDSAQRQVVKEGLFSLAELMRSEPLRMMHE